MSFGKNSGSSSGSTSTVVNQNTNGSFTPNNLPYLQAGWNAGGNLLGSTDWSNILGAGVNEADLGARNANGLNTSAGGAATNFANGDYVNNPANGSLSPIANGGQLDTQNPAFQQMVGQIGAALRPQVDGSFAADGRYGSGANANAFASALTNTTGQLAYQNYNDAANRQISAADILSGNYNTGRQQQLTGAGLAPGLVTSNFVPSAGLTALGFSGPSQYQGLVASGNPGGSTTGAVAQTSNGTGNTNQNQFAGGLSFGGVPLFK